MKLANGLSLLRVVLTPPLVLLLLWQTSAGFLGATLLWFVAAWSDVFDGYFARRRAAVSKLGVFIDLVADKFATSSVLIAFVDLGILPSWAVIVVIGREFLITGFRTFAASEGVVIPAAAWGKQKTAVTNLALGMLMLRADYALDGPTTAIPGIGPILATAPWLFYLGVVLTVTSGLLYVWSGRGLLVRLSS
ncbi:MAG: CDP-diacylglycerol--glycerol-3-phosphate 3-phosphatidyltransferase [Chloroflexota bacterium]|nr:CDP-diacylglycerol--glycerol-3-phosphate 3-phosphatidyltransferase [Chloroflexota bacterium]